MHHTTTSNSPAPRTVHLTHATPYDIPHAPARIDVFAVRQWPGNTADLDFLRLDRDAFAKCPNVAIDVAVMEQTELGTVLPLDAGWSDVGSWSALWDTADRDENGNVLRGRVISEGSKNCYLRSEHRLVVGLGVENLVVVETDDAVLIADRSQAQNF